MHKLLNLYLLLFVTCSSVYSDDSLQSLYKATFQSVKLKDTTKIIESYKYLGDYLSETGDFEKSEIYLNKGLQYAQKKQNLYEVGIYYNLLASNASYAGNRPLALSYYHKALKAFADINNADKVAMVMMNMGSEYEYAGDLPKAIAYIIKAIKNKEASGIRKNLDYYYQNLGQLFKETNSKKWEYYVRKAYEISKTLPDSRIQTKAAIFNDLGGIAKLNGKNEEAFAWYDSMLTVSKKNEYLNGMGTAYSNRSLLYMDNGKYEKALDDILEAIKISEQTGRNYSKILDNIHAANILIKMNQPTEAKKHALVALQLAESLKYYPEEEASAHLALANIGEKTKNWKLAYENYNAYKTGIDSIRNTEVQKNLHNLEIKYQTAEKENRISQLNNENKIKSIRLQQSKILFYALIISVLFISTVILFLYIRKRLALQKHQIELKQQLLRSQMNPHFIFNTLNAINQYIQKNQGNIASDYLAKYSKLMRQILENSAVEFIPLESEIEFLHNYITMQQLRFDNKFEYTIQIDNKMDISNLDIPPMIAQPFIENAIEHGLRNVAEGAKLEIALNMINAELLLTVTDNGTGFKNETETKDKHRSFALEITRERLKIHGGKPGSIHIESPVSGTGKGTKITVIVPYKM